MMLKWGYFDMIVFNDDDDNGDVNDDDDNDAKLKILKY